MHSVIYYGGDNGHQRHPQRLHHNQTLQLDYSSYREGESQRNNHRLGKFKEHDSHAAALPVGKWNCQNHPSKHGENNFDFDGELVESRLIRTQQQGQDGQSAGNLCEMQRTQAWNNVTRPEEIQE